MVCTCLACGQRLKYRLALINFGGQLFVSLPIPFERKVNTRIYRTVDMEQYNAIYQTDTQNQYIPGQKSNDTNYWPHFQGIKCVELIVAHVCLGRRQGAKCTENRQPVLFHIRVIWPYSIGVNWNAPHCCACA